MADCCFLVKRGYGTLREIKAFDTPEFLDCLEFEKIETDIKNYLTEQARNGI